MELIRSTAALIVFFVLCGSASGQYLGFQQNLDGCLARNEYQACKAALAFSSANITSEQRQRVEAKMRAIQAGIAPAPTPLPTPYDDLEKGFQKGAQFVGIVFQIFFGLIALLIVFVLYLMVSRKSKDRLAWAQLPKDGPMKVNIEESFTPPGSFNSKQVPCGLKIDVTISQKDWRAIAAAGLMKKVLFQADGPSGQKYDPENVRDWLVEDLKRVTLASFWDTDRMQQAKERLIDSLHNLRAHIDSIRQGPKKETMEI